MTTRRMGNEGIDPSQALCNQRASATRVARMAGLAIVVMLASACSVMAPRVETSQVPAAAPEPATPTPAPRAEPPPPVAVPRPAPAARPVAPPITAPVEPTAVEPRVESVPNGPPNRPYEIDGKLYVPEQGDVSMTQVGLASWYGKPFHGRRTANGEIYDMHRMTAAHKTMPLPSYALVRNPANGREVVVRVNDRGPFIPGRIIDLSLAAARALGIAGLGRVEVVRLTHTAIREGSWRRPVQVAVTR